MYPPAPQPVQQFHDHMNNWLARNGYVRPRRAISYVDQLNGSGSFTGKADAIAEDDSIRYAQPFHEGLNYFAARLGAPRGRLNEGHFDAARAALHESIHRPRPGMNFTPQQLEWEEMATESAARDNMPAFLKQMYGHNIGREYQSGSYSEPVKNFRALSALGDPVNSRAARLRRRQFANDPEQRQALWDQWHAWHQGNPG